MDIYKKATREGVRFNTNKGVLTVEQLWSLSLAGLKSAIIEQSKLIKGDSDNEVLSFLETTNNVNPTEQLIFDILKDVYVTKQKEAEELKNQREIKEHNEKIMALIAAKEENELKELSIEELKARLKQ